MCPKIGLFGGFEGKDVKILSSNPQKALPCVNYTSASGLAVTFVTLVTLILFWLIDWLIACKNRFNGMSCKFVEIFCAQRRNKKVSGNFGYMGRINPWGNLDQMWLVGRYGGHNHVCNISWLSVKGCGCGERGKFAFSHWLDESPLQHWSHYRVTVWSYHTVTWGTAAPTLNFGTPSLSRKLIELGSWIWHTCRHLRVPAPCI